MLVVLYALWQGDLNQDLFLSPTLKGTRSGFIRNSMWTVWTKPALWARRCQQGGRGVQPCRAHSHSLSGTGQDTASEPGRFRAQAGITWCSALWVSGEGEPTKHGMDQTFYLYIPLVENRPFFPLPGNPQRQQLFLVCFFFWPSEFPLQSMCSSPITKKIIFLIKERF